MREKSGDKGKEGGDKMVEREGGREREMGVERAKESEKERERERQRARERERERGIQNELKTDHPRLITKNKQANNPFWSMWSIVEDAL